MGHPVYSRATYIRNGGARGRVRSRGNVCARPCVYACMYIYAKRSGGCCSPACLPACLPRLSGALPDRTLNPARLNLGIIRGYKPRRYSALRTLVRPPANLPAIFRSALSTGARGEPRHPFSSSPAPLLLLLLLLPWRESRQYPPASQVTLRTRRLWNPNCSFARIAREHFRRWTTRETRRRTDVRGALFCARHKRDREARWSRGRKISSARVRSPRKRENLLLQRVFGKIIKEKILHTLK